MAEAGKDCGGDLIVNERTQTNVCKAQRSPSVENVRLMMSVGKRRGKEAERSGRRHHLVELGLVIAAGMEKSSHDAGRRFDLGQP